MVDQPYTAEIAIETDDPELAKAILELAIDSDAFATRREGLDGITLTTIIVTLSPILIAPLFRLVRSTIEARKHVRFVKDGVTIEGVSEATLLKIIEREARKKK